jgi:hypothetical protein
MASPIITTQPMNVTVLAGQPASFHVVATGAAPLFYQWLFNGDALAGETGGNTFPGQRAAGAGRRLQRARVQWRWIGRERVRDSHGSTVAANSKPAAEPQRESQQQRQLYRLRPRHRPLRYQWFYNGSIVLGATNATLTLTNVQLPQAGNYAVMITDDIGSVASQPAALIVLVRPTITLQPLSQAVVAGSTATFTIAATGATPIGFRWRKAGLTTTNGILINTPTSSSFTVTNAQASDAVTYTCVATNIAGNAPTSSNAVLTVLADGDMDGIPDTLEPLDGAADSDGDTLSNAAEYFAGRTGWIHEAISR